VERAAEALVQLHELVLRGYPLGPQDVEQASRLIRQDPEVSLPALYGDTITVGPGRRKVHPRSLRQQQYVQAIREAELVVGLGPAGTGKTYLAMAMAVSALMGGQVRRIVLCRPAVEAGEKLGFLPGDLSEKVDPYLRPLYDALHDLLDGERAARLVQKGVVEVAPLAFMRGRTLADAFVILDEAQNTTVPQMKMFLTRIGAGSRVVVNGDPSQVDLPRGTRSGLEDAIEVLRAVPEVRVCRFTDADVVRHPLVASIIRAYQGRDGRRGAPAPDADAADPGSDDEGR
jgi:phosphate starvation-inducible protein PhoH and related proteins